jgi:hypothetical protein
LEVAALAAFPAPLGDSVHHLLNRLFPAGSTPLERLLLVACVALLLTFLAIIGAAVVEVL